MPPSCSARNDVTRLALLLALALAASPAKAQSTEPAPAFPVQQVELAPQPELFAHGTAALFHGEVSEPGYGFTFAGVSMLQPIAVTVLADPGAPVTLAIGKEWALAERTTSTAAEGHATELFRTDDIVTLRVHAPDAATPRRYDLVIWVGDERVDYPDMPSSIDFDRPEEAQQAKVAAPPAAPPASPALAGPPAPAPAAPATAPPPTGSLQLVLWVIAALLAALVAIAGVAVLRRKKP